MSRKTHNDLMNSIDEKANEIIKDMSVFAEKYFNNMDDRNLSKRTKLQYAYDMKQFFDFFSERYPKMKAMSAAELLEDISIEDLQEYTQSLKYHYSKDGKKQLNSNSYKARRIASLHSFYAYYHKIGLIDKLVITHEYSWQNRLFFDIYSIYMYTIYREDACTLLIVF